MKQFVDAAKNTFSSRWVRICGNKGEYSKAQELYEKLLGSLSKAQKKRLEYIRKTRKERVR